MLKKVFLFVLIFTVIQSYSQSKKCDLHLSKSNEIYAVNKKDIICLSKNTSKDKTLIFTFGIWCAPCRLHLPNAIKLAEKYNLNFYVLLIEKEKSKIVKSTINYLKKVKPDINILILKDEYGKRKNKKYKKFLTDITPSKFENINDMSKYIIIDKKGEVIMVTNWKDNKDNDWRDDSKMIEKTIIPVLKN